MYNQSHIRFEHLVLGYCKSANSTLRIESGCGDMRFPTVDYGRRTRRPSLDGAVARLKLCIDTSAESTMLTTLADSRAQLYMSARGGRLVALGGQLGIRTLSHSSHALPAPKPSPDHTGHALRLNSSTEKITPNDAPRVLRMRRVLRQ